jgi:hypothetical protein
MLRHALRATLAATFEVHKMNQDLDTSTATTAEERL